MIRDSKKVENFFHGYAGSFDAIYGHTQRRTSLGRWIDKNLRKVMRLRFEETLHNTANSEITSVLDIGCGPGRYTAEFLKQGKKVIAIDLAEGMLEIAQQTISSVPHPPKAVVFLKGDYLEQKISGQYDAACLMGLFDYISNPVLILRKLKKEVGKEIYASFPKKSGVLAWIRKVRYRLRNCPLYLYSEKDVKDLLRQAGLEELAEVKDFGRDYYVKIRFGN